jgi:hypothetical protein
VEAYYREKFKLCQGFFEKKSFFFYGWWIQLTSAMLEKGEERRDIKFML